MSSLERGGFLIRLFLLPSLPTGTDYWMDEKVVEAEKRRKAKRKVGLLSLPPSLPPSFPASFPASPARIPIISITIFSIAFVHST